jgi:hypothetical protein
MLGGRERVSGEKIIEMVVAVAWLQGGKPLKIPNLPAAPVSTENREKLPRMLHPFSFPYPTQCVVGETVGIPAAWSTEGGHLHTGLQLRGSCAPPSSSYAWKDSENEDGKYVHLDLYRTPAAIRIARGLVSL